MLRPDFAARSVAATLAQEAARIALPLGHPSAGGSPSRNAGVPAGTFRAAFDEVRGEVVDFIAGGARTFGAAAGATALSVEGHARRLDLQDGPGADNSQQREFIASIAPWARGVGNALGVEPEVVAAHAALESGWGRRPLRAADGGSTHNLFGVKAGSTWSGEVVRALTTEVEDGMAIKRKERFRDYADVGEAFRDYAQLLLGQSRFAAALNTGADAAAFGQGLMQGSYATDPAYARKIERVARQVRAIGLPPLPGAR